MRSTFVARRGVLVVVGGLCMAASLGRPGRVTAAEAAPTPAAPEALMATG